MDIKASPNDGASEFSISEPSILHKMSTEALSSAITFSTFEYNGSIQFLLPFHTLKAAWGILLAKYMSSARAVFGTMSGVISSKTTLEEWICYVDQKAPMADAVSLNKCRDWEVHEAPFGKRFNTCVVESTSYSDESIGSLLKDLGSIDLIISLKHEGPLACISMYSRASFLDQKQLELLQNSLIHTVNCFPSKCNSSLESTSLVSKIHHSQIQKWNQMAPVAPLGDCIHHVIIRQRHRYPLSEAVCAWDGIFAYQELDDASSNIHRVLFDHAVRPGFTIPLIFEKSKWTVAAMLGVLKSGAAFVTLDPTLPENRLRTICEDVRAPLVLSSVKQQCMADRLHHNTIIVPTSVSSSLSTMDYPETVGSSHDPAYIAYTSGSTGTPKGIIIDHGAFCTNAMLSSASQRLDKQSRVLQFASYAFDVSIHETLVPLMHGGCVCIPSDSQRVNNLHGAISDLRVNWLELVPSVARLLDFDTLPAVETLVVGGETMRPGDIDRLPSRLHLVQAYGPAECTVVSTVQSHLSPGSNPSNIGHSPAGSCWLVEPDNHQKLVPIGAVGELIIGGPIVGKGYLNRPEETSRSFITNPPWSTNTQPHYKTGDLAFQNSDGSIVYMGRKDTQVKIRGQRVELGEIEYHAQQICPGSTVLADAISIDGREKTLMLFIGDLRDGLRTNPEKPLLLEPDTAFQASMEKIQVRLKELLPEYLVPTAFIPFKRIPLMPSGKIDRKEIRAFASSLSSIELQKFRSRCLSHMASRRPPQINNSEGVRMQLRQLFSKVLELHDEVSDDDNFFLLGGDSSLAIFLVNEARIQHNIEITVASIFHNPTVSELAQVAHRKSTGSSFPQPLAPFSLIPPDNVEHLCAVAMTQCGVKRQDIEDIYPTTPLQERLVSWTLHKPGAFHADFVFRFPPTVDRDRLFHAWRVIVRAHPILRTRIILNDSSLSFSRGIQVVIRDDIAWEQTTRTTQNNNFDMTTGSSLIYLTFPSGSDQHLKLSMHHALFDLWSYNHMLDAVAEVYHGGSVVPSSFALFIERLTSADKASARQFWTNEFDCLQELTFPASVLPGYTPREVQCQISRIPLKHARPRGITLSTMCRLAWALVIAHYTNSLDTFFGVTVTGRHDFETVTALGPTTATFPLRVRLNRGLKVGDTLRKIQEHATEIMPYEQSSLHFIRQCSPEAVIASQFQSLLVVQPAEKSPSRHSSSRDLLKLVASEASRQRFHSSFATQILTVICEPTTDDMEVQMVFDPAIITSSEIGSIFQRMRGYLDSIMESPTDTVGTLLQHHTEIGPQDRLPTKRKLSQLEIATPNDNHLLDSPQAYNASFVSEVETTLRYIMAHVLRLDEASIGPNDSFFTLGGDSLLAIQVVTQCRHNNINLSTHDIFDAKTIRAMALRSSKVFARDQSPHIASGIEPSHQFENPESFKARMTLSHNSSAQIEDAYPCTRAHHGLLTDGAINDYLSYTIWEVSKAGHQVDAERLALAWHRLSARHAALRTILCDDSSTKCTMHMVLASPPQDIKVMSKIKDEDLTSMLRASQLHREDGEILPCQFTIYQTVSFRVFCRLEGTHAFLDATSIMILLKELSLSYDNRLPPSPGPSYRSWVTYQTRWNEDPQHFNYWKTKLSGLRPCIFPRLYTYSNRGHGTAPRQLQTISRTVTDTKHILDFCHGHEITATTLLQCIWALVLQKYCKSSDICFGTTTSGRDAPLTDVEDTVGSLFNVIPCRIQLSQSMSVMDMLRTNQQDLQERTLHQFCSLADLESLLPSTNHHHMFNTCLSVESTLSCQGEMGLGYRVLETKEETRNDLIATVTLLPHEAEVQLMYWSEFLDETHATRVADGFRKCVLQILSDPSISLVDMQLG